MQGASGRKKAGPRTSESGYWTSDRASVLADLVSDHAADDTTGHCAPDIPGDGGACRGTHTRADDGVGVAVTHAAAAR